MDSDVVKNSVVLKIWRLNKGKLMPENFEAKIEDKYKSRWNILIAVMVGSFAMPLDGSIVNTILPTLAQYFDTKIAIVQWVPTVYLLTVSCLILLYGRLGDMVGHKKIFLYGLGAFTVASALCGFSNSIWMLIVFRAIQGLAAGMVMAVGLAIITPVFPPQNRGKAIGTFAVSIAIALSIGPSLGGFISGYLGWRYVFFVNVPIGLVALVWGARIIPAGNVKKGQTLDVAGAIIAFLFMLFILLFANKGGAWGWASFATISLLTMSIISAVLFIMTEQRVSQPMLNLGLFRNRVFLFANLGALLSFMAAFAAVFLTPFFLTIILNYNIQHVGLVMTASPLATLLIAPFSGSLSDRIGTRGLTFFGMIITAAGFFFLSGLDQTATAIDVAWPLALTGFGAGMFQSPNNSAVMGNIPPTQLGIASGMLATMRNVGMVLGIAMSAAILYNVSPLIESGWAAVSSGTAPGELVPGFHWGYIFGGVFALLAAVASLFAIPPKKKEAQQ